MNDAEENNPDIYITRCPDHTIWSEFLRDCNPHDVELIIKYEDGTESKLSISWDTISSLAKYHNKCAVAEMYELNLLNKEI